MEQTHSHRMSNEFANISDKIPTGGVQKNISRQTKNAAK